MTVGLVALRDQNHFFFHKSVSLESQIQDAITLLTLLLGEVTAELTTLSQWKHGTASFRNSRLVHCKTEYNQLLLHNMRYAEMVGFIILFTSSQVLDVLCPRKLVERKLRHQLLLCSIAQKKECPSSQQEARRAGFFIISVKLKSRWKLTASQKGSLSFFFGHFEL